MSAFVTALGWVGAVTCLVAYVFVTRGKWAPTSGRYQLANVVSGLFMGMVAASSGVWPSVVTNAVWAVVGVHAVAMVLRARRQRSRDAAATGAAADAPAGTAVLPGPPVAEISVPEVPPSRVEPLPAGVVDLAA